MSWGNAEIYCFPTAIALHKDDKTRKRITEHRKLTIELVKLVSQLRRVVRERFSFMLLTRCNGTLTERLQVAGKGILHTYIYHTYQTYIHTCTHMDNKVCKRI